MVLFLSLSITFFLLAAGVSHPRADKVHLIGSDWHIKLAAVCQAGNSTLCLWQAGGYFGIWTAGVAWYIAFAELLNEVWFRGRVSLFSAQGFIPACLINPMKYCVHSLLFVSIQ